MNGIYLSRLPLSGKVFCTLYLVGIGCGALAAFAQAATAVGLSPAEVQASLAPEMPMTHMEHGQMSDENRKIRPSHTHLFGQTLIAGLLGLIFLFSSLGEGKKTLILALPFVGTVMDIGGMWLTRFVWPPLSVLVILGGGLFALGYVVITVVSLYDLWVRKEVRA